MLKGSLAPISNRADWVETIIITEKPSISAAQFRVRGGCIDITKTLDDGITYDQETGKMVVTFSETEVKRFEPGTYEVGAQCTIGGVKTALIVESTVAVLDGVVA